MGQTPSTPWAPRRCDLVKCGSDNKQKARLSKINQENDDKQIDHSFKSKGHKPYDIPYPSLVAADVDGLLVAGRCISGDFVAHSSYRVTGNSVPMGEATGLAAAKSIELGVMPHELSWDQVKG